MATINDRITTLIGAELATRAFGIQAFDFPAGFPDYPEHNHAESRQEEVYVVLAGSANVELNGERVAVERGTALRVGSHTTRRLIPGPQGIHVLVIGATPASSTSGRSVSACHPRKTSVRDLGLRDR